jgi:hypothetical protein
MRHHYEQHAEAFLSRIAKGDVTWVFHYILDSKAEILIFKHPYSPIKKMFKPVQSPGKVMATVFWNV